MNSKPVRAHDPRGPHPVIHPDFIKSLLPDKRRQHEAEIRRAGDDALYEKRVQDVINQPFEEVATAVAIPVHDVPPGKTSGRVAAAMQEAELERQEYLKFIKPLEAPLVELLRAFAKHGATSTQLIALRESSMGLFKDTWHLVKYVRDQLQNPQAVEARAIATVRLENALKINEVLRSHRDNLAGFLECRQQLAEVKESLRDSLEPYVTTLRERGFNVSVVDRVLNHLSS